MKAADGMIGAVLADLEKWERQEPSMNAPSEKRTLNMLPIAQGRLDGSSNKGDTSWKNAQERLETLKARLEGKQSTKPLQPTLKQENQTSSALKMISSDRAHIQKYIRDLQTCLRMIQSAQNVAALDREDSKLDRLEQQLAAFRKNFAHDLDVQKALGTLKDARSYSQEHRTVVISTQVTTTAAVAQPAPMMI